jgi:hypothetical protein
VQYGRRPIACQELVSTDISNAKALGCSRMIRRFEARPFEAQVGELAEDDQSTSPGVAAGLVPDAQDVARVVVVEGHR